MEYFSALKKKEMLTQATVRMNLENMMPNEINQTQRVIFANTHLSEAPRIVKSLKTERRMVVSRGPGEGRFEELLFHGDRASVWGDKNFLEMCKSDDDVTV